MKLGKLLQRDLTTGLSRQFLMDSVTDTTEAALGNLPSNKTADYIRIIGSDGESYKISRADFASIIRSELGTILNGLSDQQTVTKVPTLNGATLGASAIATLASVLGEHFGVLSPGKTLVISGDINFPFSGTITTGKTQFNSLTYAIFCGYGEQSLRNKVNKLIYSDGSITYGIGNSSKTVYVKNFGVQEVDYSVSMMLGNSMTTVSVVDTSSIESDFIAV